MLPTLTSLLFLVSFAPTGDAIPASHLASISSIESRSSLAIVALPATDTNRPVDLLCESDPDEEEDDSPTDDAHDGRGWSFRVTVDQASPGDLIAIRSDRRSLDRSRILRC